MPPPRLTATEQEKFWQLVASGNPLSKQFLTPAERDKLHTRSVVLTYVGKDGSSAQRVHRESLTTSIRNFRVSHTDAFGFGLQLEINVAEILDHRVSLLVWNEVSRAWAVLNDAKSVIGFTSLLVQII